MYDKIFFVFNGKHWHKILQAYEYHSFDVEFCFCPSNGGRCDLLNIKVCYKINVNIQ